MAKFIQSDPKKVAKTTAFKWAIDKTTSMTKALGLSLRNLWDKNTAEEHQDHHECLVAEDKKEQHKERGGKGVSFCNDFKHHHHQHHTTGGSDDRLTMAMDN
jgi:hypothetical protein